MNTSHVVLAADHGGFELKEAVKKYLEDKGVKITDAGAYEMDPKDDYPAIIRKGCTEVLKHKTFGIIFGGSGNGEAMAANKVKGIRAAVGYSVEIARLARFHNDANILSIGGRFIDQKTAFEMVDTFLSTDFEGGRHEQRVKDIE